MDHHCPWVGNCVAQNTLKPFFIFTLLVVVLSAIQLTVMIYNYNNYKESKRLQHVSLNPIRLELEYMTYAIRLGLAKVLVPNLCSREDLGLWPVDANGENIYPDGYDHYGWIDNTNFVLTLVFLLFAGLINGLVVRNQMAGESPIDRLKKRRRKTSSGVEMQSLVTY